LFLFVTAKLTMARWRSSVWHGSSTFQRQWIVTTLGSEKPYVVLTCPGPAWRRTLQSPRTSYATHWSVV